MVSYFLNNAVKTFLYGLKILENVDIEYVFHFKAFFFVSVAISTQVTLAPLMHSLKKVFEQSKM